MCSQGLGACGLAATASLHENPNMIAVARRENSAISLNYLSLTLAPAPNKEGAIANSRKTSDLFGGEAFWASLLLSVIWSTILHPSKYHLHFGPISTCFSLQTGVSPEDEHESFEEAIPFCAFGGDIPSAARGMCPTQ
jgi:hypothetical protein